MADFTNLLCWGFSIRCLTLPGWAFKQQCKGVKAIIMRISCGYTGKSTNIILVCP